MSQNTTVDVIIKVVVYGVPALLIVFGFIAYIEWLCNSSSHWGLRNDESWNWPHGSWDCAIYH